MYLKNEVIILNTKTAYKLTGLVVLVLGILFFLRDIGINFIGNTSGWTIVIVLIGAGLLAGEVSIKTKAEAKAAKMKTMK